MKFSQYLKEESKFVIFKDSEPFEVVASRKEAQDNIQDYKSHKDYKNTKFDIRLFNDIASKLKNTKPESYKELIRLDKQNSKVN
jgi:hypothetical protein